MRVRQSFGLAILGLGLVVMLSGCGPGLIILGGGGAGGWLGLSGGDDDKEKQPTTPGPVGPTNTAPVAIVQSLVRAESPADIDFRLIDAEADLIDVIIEYALVADPQDSDFNACTGAVGSSITGLTSSAGGTNHTFQWDYATDLGGLASQDGITIRVRPNDGTVDGSPGSLGDLVVGNDAPVVMTAQAVGAVLSGNVLITFDLADSTADMAGFEVRVISTQQPEPIELTGTDFLGTNPIGLPGVLNTSSGGTTGQIVWDSAKVFPFHDGSIQILITPKDQPAGFSQIGQGNALTIGPYTLTNVGNRTPTLQIGSPPGGKTFYGGVGLRALVQDLDANSVYINCQYQTDSGMPYADCNMGSGAIGTVGPFATLANQPLGYDLTWHAMLDLQSQGILLFDRCRLRLTVMDTETGQVVETGQFAVVLGEAPTITSAQVQGDDGSIPIVINVLDRASDPVSIQVGYNFDNGAVFTPLAQAHFSFGNLSSLISGPAGSGYANVLIWNTLHADLAADFGTTAGNKPTVYLQIIATDHPPDDDTGDAFDLELDTTYVLGPFPVLNDPSDLNVVSVTITETSGGDDFTIAPTETRDFLATALPTQPSPFDEVNWWFYPDWILTPTTLGPSTTTSFTLNADTEGHQYVEVYAWSVQNGVQGYYRIYIGDPVSAIDAQPDTEVTLVEGQGWVQFTAAISPPSAPQNQFWSVPEGMGYIQWWDGWYEVPFDVPATLLFDITVTTVDPGKSDTIPVRVVPRPDSVSINGPSSVAVGTAGVAFSATVQPPEAPQQVFWEIEWNGFNYGQGNDYFGRIDSSGVYTPPVVLPQPDYIIIIARSQFDYFVYSTKSLQLTGVNPTNFSIVMDPPSPSHVFANGQGKDFNAVNFTPPDAPYVTWTVDQPLGWIDSVTGYYTPPEDIGPTAQSVTIRATATYGGLQRTLNLLIQPRLNDPPTSITIKPSPALMPEDSYGNIDFLQLVNPLQAEQDVTWNIQVGLPPPANSGSVDGQGRYYPPFNYSNHPNDGTVVVRAQSVPVPAVGANVNVNLAGVGTWTIHDMPSMGRNDATGIWDPTTQRCWFFGGRSETTRLGEMDLRPWVYDGGPAPAARWVAGPTIADVIPQWYLKNAIAVQRVPFIPGNGSPHLVALVGDGSNEITMAVLNLVAPTAWQVVGNGYDSGAGADGDDIPRLTGIGRYHLLVEPSTQELMLLSGGTIYRLSYQSGLWLPRFQNVANQPAQPNNLAYYDDLGKHRLLGPVSNISIETSILELELVPTPQWITIAQTSAGVGPRSPPLSDAAVVRDPASGNLITFGGHRGTATVDEVWVINPGAGTWALQAAVAIRPFARSDAAFVAVSENGVGKLVLYGGRGAGLGLGIAGDLWEYSTATTSFLAFNPSGIIPQARKWAGTVWAGTTAGYMYGGLCQYGVSNETWRFTYNPSNPVPFSWTRFAYSAATTPPALWAQNMVFDSVNNRVLMLWGSNGAAYQLSNIVSILNTASNTWTQMGTITGSPPQTRLAAAVCFDPDQQRVVTFGGLRQASQGAAITLLNDISFLKVIPVGSPAWLPLGTISGTPPPPVYGAFAGYDTATYFTGSSRYVILGGNRNPNGENANSEIFTFNTQTNQWGSIILSRPYFARPAFDCAGAFDPSAFRRFIYAPKYERHAVAPILGNFPEWQSLAQGTFDFNPRSAMGVYDPNSKRFFALMGEVDIPGVGPAVVCAFRVLRFGP